MATLLVRCQIDNEYAYCNHERFSVETLDKIALLPLGRSFGIVVLWLNTAEELIESCDLLCRVGVVVNLSESSVYQGLKLLQLHFVRITSSLLLLANQAKLCTGSNHKIFLFKLK